MAETTGVPPEPISALGSRRTSSGAVIVDTPQLKFSETPWLKIFSLRASKMHSSEQSLSALLASLGLQVPGAANAVQGSLQRSVSWLEPRAWLLVSASDVEIARQAHWLITDISDRVAVFTVQGERARDVIAAGCDPQILRPGTMARTRFGGMANVIVEQWGVDEYRLLIDVSIASAFAAWMKMTADNLLSVQ